MSKFKKFLNDIFTGRDNRTYDLGRVLWFQSVQAFIAVTIYSLYKGGVFDAVTWGAGLSALVARSVLIPATEQNEGSEIIFVSQDIYGFKSSVFAQTLQHLTSAINQGTPDGIYKVEKGNQYPLRYKKDGVNIDFF